MGRPQQRQGENRKPAGRHQHRRADVPAVGHRHVQQTSGGPVTHDETGVDQQQQQHAAAVAGGPAQSGDPAGGLRGGQLTQHRVVRDARQIAARSGQRQQRQPRRQIAGIGTDEDHRGGEHHGQRGQHRQRDPAPAGNLNHDAGERGQQCHRQPGDGQRPAQPARRRGIPRQAHTDRAGQIHGEDERRHDGVESGGPAVP